MNSQPAATIQSVRPEWLFEVASAFQRCALLPIGRSIAMILNEVRVSVPPPCSPLECLILDHFLIRATTQIKPFERCATVHADTLVDRALKLIHERCGDNLTYTAIGRAIGCDPEYLEVLFRKRTGASIHTYLRRYRVAKALEAIRNGVKIEAAALDSGFRSNSGFIRACRRVTGRTPGQIRTQPVQ